MRIITLKTLSIFGTVVASLTASAQNWPQAAGPHHTWSVEGKAPIEWSVTRNENILWKTPMPEAGMSGATVWGDRVFVTTHKPAESLTVSDVIGYCLDANTGKILWTTDLPGNGSISLASSFSDGTTYPPITDGKYVWFFNRLGLIRCVDFNGKTVWERSTKLRFKHANRMHKPMLVDDWILVVEVDDKEKHSRPAKEKYPKGLQKDRSAWTYIHALDKSTGEIVWREDVGTAVHLTSGLFKMPDGTYTIYHGRGGGHRPLETPYGVSLTQVTGPQSGETLWSNVYKTYFTSVKHQVHSSGALAFVRNEHLVLDLKTGQPRLQTDLLQPDLIWSYDEQADEWTTQIQPEFEIKRITNQSNLLVNDWHYFRLHDDFYLGRVHVKTGRLEYLQLPAILSASASGRTSDTWMWTLPKDHKTNPSTPNGVKIVSKRGLGDSGWGHISNGSPIAVGKHIFMPTVTGTVYVIDSEAETLSPESIVAINDMGPMDSTWSLAPLTFSNGKLFMQTADSIICVASK